MSAPSGPALGNAVLFSDQLFRSGIPVGERAAQGQSEGFEALLAPLALGDELRAALITGGACWGFLCLHRDRSSSQFTPAEVAFVGRLAPHMAEGLRKALLLGNTTGSKVPDEPGLLLLAEDLSVVAITPAAERWLSEVAEVDWSRKLVMPSAISAVVARLREIEQNNEIYPTLLLDDNAHGRSSDGSRWTPPTPASP